MDDFTYHKQRLCCEKLDAARLADEFGTPLYVYSSATLHGHYERFARAFARLDPLICFSVKSCQNVSILRRLCAWGAAFDVVSGGEIRRALDAGSPPQRIVFAGVGKTDAEIELALASGIGWFNAESEAELDNIARLAEARCTTARVALRINPDVDPHTHKYTTTGLRETKFGVDIDRAGEVFDAFRGRAGLSLGGLHLHLGSPVNEVEPYVTAIERALELVDRLRGRGHAVEALNIGGGFGAHYDGSEAPVAAAYAERICPMLEGTGLKILMEPGRSIAANAGILLTRVLYRKSSGKRRFVVVDASIADLVRPALYGAFHFVWPVCPGEGQVPASRAKSVDLPGLTAVDVVGPVCESGDFLARDRMLPPVDRGDLLAVFSVGAYGITMSSQYNSRPRAPEVLVEGDVRTLIRRRETYADLVASECAES